ncbi:MAG TPA: hypothetical protein VJ731_10450 [Terriglobales bacterium]|nr:hypothetical protein [Terriglobales bacterium]
MSSKLDVEKRKMMFCEDVDKVAKRKYRLRMLVSMAVYVALVYVSVRWLHRQPPTPWKYVIAVMPMLPVLLVPVFVVQFLHSLDELQRRIQLESLGFAFAATALSSLTYGFLENAGLPHLNWVWVWPIMGIFWILGMMSARWRYR